MNLSLVAFFLGICFTVVASQSTSSPVLTYFKGSANSKNAITVGTSLSSNKFEQEIRDQIQPGPVHIILVNNLRDEDIRLLLKSSLKAHKPQKITYEPSVQDALSTLTGYLGKNQLEYLITEVDDAEKALQTFVESLAVNNNLILTGRNEEDSMDVILRLRREANSAEDMQELSSGEFANDTYNVKGKECAASFKKISMLNQTLDLSTPEVGLVIDSNQIDFNCDSNTTASLKIGFTNNTIGGIKEINLEFGKIGLYWLLVNSSVILVQDGTGTANSSYTLTSIGGSYDMATPETFSYVCTRSYFRLKTLSSPAMNTRIAIFIQNFQFQPFGVSMNGTDFSYGKLNYCQGFFSNGIWMALTSSLVMLMILFGGIYALAGITTMDRFDDPKGKPLNIALEK